MTLQQCVEHGPKVLLVSPTTISQFLKRKDPIIAEPIKRIARIHETREKRNIPKFAEDEYQVQASFIGVQNLNPESSNALKNFLEYGVYRA